MDGGEFVMEGYGWAGWVMAATTAAGLGWAIFRYWSNRQPRITIQCTIDSDSNPDDKVTLSIMNIGTTPAVIEKIMLSFHRTNTCTKEVTYETFNLLSSEFRFQPYPIILPSGAVEYRHMSLNSFGDQVYKIILRLVGPRADSFFTPYKMQIKTICAIDSLGKKWQTHSQEVETINRKLAASMTGASRQS